MLAVAFGIAGATIGFFAAAFVTSSVLGLVLAALALCFIISSGVAALGTRRIGAARGPRVALAVGMASTALACLLGALSIFRPLSAAAEPLPLPEGAAYWDLPTGSRIAYLRVPAAGNVKPTPIIRVHGGPGAYAVSNRHAVDLFAQLAQDGYDVYFYDQIGSGLSERLPDPGDYTMMRQVADLDAIRQKIGADQVILIGESWGGTIVANYMAAYPQGVAKVIFSSPAPIDPAEWSEYQVDLRPRLPAAQRQQFETLSSQPRFLAVYFMQTINPRAAHDFVPDGELDGFWDTLVGTQLAGLVCDPAHLANVEAPRGFGGWAALRDGSDLYDKRAALNPRARLASNQTPALILRGECDHIKAEVTQQYRETLARSTLVSFPGAGHIIYAEQPEMYLAAIRRFLREDQPPVSMHIPSPWSSP